jgi:hypothetical protein
MADDITAMLNESKLPISFWNEALATMVHVWNRLPTSFLPSSTSHEEWYKKKPDVSHLRVFGCTAYVFIQRDQRKKLGSHAQKCIFVGYPPGYKGWKFYNPTTKKFIISECAEFDERYFPGLAKGSNAAPIQLLPESTPDFSEPEHVLFDTGSLDAFTPPTPSNPSPQTPAISPPQTPISSPPSLPPLLQRWAANPRRNAGIPPRDWDATLAPIPALQLVQPSDDDESGPVGDGSHSNVDPEGDLLLQSALSTQYADPQSFKEAMMRPDSEQWQIAADAEMKNHFENGTWEYVLKPPDAKIIGSKWVFLIKRKADGSIERYKGRVVAQGYAQRPGFEYAEDATFSPTYRPASLRLILALSAQKKLHLRSVDISAAFLLGTDITEEIYMRQPPGFHQSAPNMVCRLCKPLYGLKQSARNWNQKLHQVLTDMGFKRLESDRAV